MHGHLLHCLLSCAVSCCLVLPCAVLCCLVLSCVALCCVVQLCCLWLPFAVCGCLVLFWSALCCLWLPCAVLCCLGLPFAHLCSLCCLGLPCAALCCLVLSELPCVAFCSLVLSCPIKYYSSVFGGLRETKAYIWVQGSICYRGYGFVKSTVLFLNFLHIVQLDTCFRFLERITNEKSRLFYSSFSSFHGCR